MESKSLLVYRGKESTKTVDGYEEEEEEEEAARNFNSSK